MLESVLFLVVAPIVLYAVVALLAAAPRLRRRPVTGSAGPSDRS